jgi:hypothetical protein
MNRIQSLLNYKAGLWSHETKKSLSLWHQKSILNIQNACFENALTKQIEKVTVENGFDAKALLLFNIWKQYWLSTRSLTENENIRFIANNLAYAYLLLENKKKALYYADVLVKMTSKLQEVQILIDVNKANFATNVIRTHTFVCVKSSGF